jgi:hypothetical protein
MYKARGTCLLVIFVFVLGFATQGFSSGLTVKPGDYPSLSDKEMGHIRWIVKLAQQPPGDWSYMGGEEEGQEWMEAYRYQLAFMTYALALAQYHKTPAYGELYQKTIDSLVQKMTRRDVWAFWAESSKGGKKLNPALKEKGPGWIDPVADKNIMYSGHILHMVELYQMLYRDRKYDKPGSLVFTWEWIKEPLNRFEYDSNKLAGVIHKQFKDNSWHTIECEVNAIFAQCNQHPVLGLMLYDHNHGTNLSSVRDIVGKIFLDKKFLNPDTHNFMYFYMLQQDKVIPASSPSADGWTGAFMHAWDPKLIEENYPYQAKQHVKWQPDGTASVPDKTWSSIGAPHFALLAKEVGDERTARGILAWMEKNWTPIWADGMFRYPRNDQKKITPLITNLAAVAELNVKNGIWALHNEPWQESHFAQPFISNVEYPKAVVKQAYYDKSKDLLLVTLVPGAKAAGNTAFMVNQLDGTKVYSVRKDGKLIGYVKKGAVRSNKGMKGLEMMADGGLKISTNLNKPQSFLVQAED